MLERESSRSGSVSCLPLTSQGTPAASRGSVVRFRECSKIARVAFWVTAVFRITKRHGYGRNRAVSDSAPGTII